MQTIKIGEIEIQFEESLDVTIEDSGRRLIVRGKQQLAPIVIQPQSPIPIPYPIYPRQPFYQPTYPGTWPIVTCEATAGRLQ